MSGFITKVSTAEFLFFVLDRITAICTLQKNHIHYFISLSRH